MEIFTSLSFLQLCKNIHSPKKGCGREPPNVNNSVSLWLVELWVIFSSFFIFSVLSKFSLKVTNYFQEKIYTDPSPHPKILSVPEEQPKAKKQGGQNTGSGECDQMGTRLLGDLESQAQQPEFHPEPSLLPRGQRRETQPFWKMRALGCCE